MSGGRKFDSKKYKDLRDFKNKEIKRSLTHRARLRKNYFKLLEKEQKQYPNDGPAQDKQPEEVSDGDEETEDIQKETIEKPRKPISYAERAKMIKERKEQKRKDALKAVQDRRHKIEKSKLARERAKENLTKKTKYGQPLMGPRINNLLDKIKKDQDN